MVVSRKELIFSDDLGGMVVISACHFANASKAEMAEVLRGLPGKKEQSEY